MANQGIEQAAERFIQSVVEMRSRIDDYMTRTAADDWADEAELLMAIREIGKAGARVYNTTKAMAGGSPFSLDDVVRTMRSQERKS
jgi:hypothetical protein